MLSCIHFKDKCIKACLIFFIVLFLIVHTRILHTTGIIG